MKALVHEMDRAFTHPDDSPLTTAFRSYTKGFWEGLFACYDTPYLPRTNNDQERYFRQTKARYRRITGLRNWNAYIWRSGEFVVLVDDALQQSNLLQRLQRVDYASYRQVREQLESRLLEGTHQRRFRRNPNQYLKQLEERVCLLNGQS
ncbi:hypothetical protein ACFSR7_01960 [Cohnella sp. GCM10020058]|uniref:hypothetical protein n=1 Tax=Cohnella sp. GCM10020058 TaxID=3317330 RepID=UPI003627DC1E